MATHCDNERNDHKATAELPEHAPNLPDSSRRSNGDVPVAAAAPGNFLFFNSFGIILPRSILRRAVGLTSRKKSKSCLDGRSAYTQFQHHRPH